jgi:hypothetical protein
VAIGAFFVRDFVGLRGQWSAGLGVDLIDLFERTMEQVLFR